MPFPHQDHGTPQGEGHVLLHCVPLFLENTVPDTGETQHVFFF